MLNHAEKQSRWKYNDYSVCRPVGLKCPNPPLDFFAPSREVELKAASVEGTVSVQPAGKQQDHLEETL